MGAAGKQSRNVALVGGPGAGPIWWKLRERFLATMDPCVGARVKDCGARGALSAPRGNALKWGLCGILGIP